MKDEYLKGVMTVLLVLVGISCVVFGFVSTNVAQDGLNYGWWSLIWISINLILGLEFFFVINSVGSKDRWGEDKWYSFIGSFILFLIGGFFGIVIKIVTGGIQRLVLKFGWIELTYKILIGIESILVGSLVIWGFFELNKWVHGKLNKKKKG